MKINLQANKNVNKLKQPASAGFLLSGEKYMSWYRTGTINLTKDSASIIGVNTKWAQAVNGVMPGMMMIMPDNKLYEIKNVVSDTSLVLVTAYSGATAAAQAYAVVTTYEGDLSQFSARFNALLTAMGGSRADMYNWLTSTAATISVAKDDGTTVTVKTLKAFTDEQAKFATKNADGVVPMSQGGTGAKDAKGLRENAGLGTAATFNVDLGGIGGSNITIAPQLHKNFRAWSAAEADLTKIWPRGVSVGLMTADQGWSGDSTTYIGVASFRSWDDKSAGINSCFLLASTGGGLRYRRSTGYSDDGNDLKYSAVHTIYSTQNTTKTSDGSIKAASPVVKIFHDGEFETNDESEGCTVTRLGVGKYLIENCIGMNADAAWGGVNGGFDIPKDRNGQPLIWLDFEVNADGSVLVQTYHRTYPEAPEFAQNNIEGIAAGEPIDIPADQFVSVRVEMPIDSIWNKRQAAIQAESEVLQPGNQEE